MLNIEQVKKLYNNFKSTEALRLEKLFKYYDGKHNIINKPMRKNDEAPTKAINNYAKYITTMTTGYFIGNPITYVYAEDEKMDNLNKIFKYNYESSHNADLALDMSIFGTAYELNYIDEQTNYCFAAIDPRNVITLDDGRIKPTITDAIVFDEVVLPDNKLKVIMEVYDKTDINTYECIIDKSSSNKFTYELKETVKHNIGSCPIVEYRNNKHKKGDYEDVISLIDAYNEATSTSLDDLKDFTDAYLKLKNLSGTTKEDIDDMKDTKVIMVDGDGDADWLIKNINDAYNENIKNRLKHDIHKFSFTPDLTDEAFAGNITGIAIKCKFQTLEQVRQEKERWFNKGLIKRIIMLNNFLGRYNKALDIMDLEIKYQANLPININEIVQNVNNVTGIISHRTQLSLLPFIQNVDLELEQIEEEQQDKLEYNDMLFKDPEEDKKVVDEDANRETTEAATKK